MTTQVNEKYVLSEKEINERKAIDFLKGCAVGYALIKGVKYNSTKEYKEDFAKGLHFATPQERKTSYRGSEYTYIRHANRQWVTICHIIHNRLRHDRPHTGSYELDQKFLTNFNEDRHNNGIFVKEFQKSLAEYNILIPRLPSEVA